VLITELVDSKLLTKSWFLQLLDRKPGLLVCTSRSLQLVDCKNT